MFLLVGLFLVAYFLPLGSGPQSNAVIGALALVKWYAREHVVLCLVPALFIAGAIAVFVKQGSVLRYLGPGANQFAAYSVAAISGGVLAVCSCTVLPLFAGIYQVGAGIGPATTFLYSGPAVNILAIVLTARVLGPELGLARTIAAVGFSVVIGLIMYLVFRRSEQVRTAAMALGDEAKSEHPFHHHAVLFILLVAVLVFANWGQADDSAGFMAKVFFYKWWITGFAAMVLAVVLGRWYRLSWRWLGLSALIVVILAVLFPDHPILSFGIGSLSLAVILNNSQGEMRDWFDQTWGFAKQILPLLFGGVLVAGLLLGSPGNSGFIPTTWIASLTGGNSIWANLGASVAGAMMYFATLTEVPILEGLISNGMGPGPALALLLAGPAVSLPNLLVIRSIMGTKRTIVYLLLVVGGATVSGILYGFLQAG